MPERLTESLIRRGLLDPDRAREALQRQVLLGGALDTCLLELRLVEEHALLDAMASAYGLATANPGDIGGPVDVRATRGFPEQWAKKHTVAPVALDPDRPLLTVLSPAPADISLLIRLGELLDLTIKPLLAPEHRVYQRLSLLYGEPPPERFRALIEHAGGGERARADERRGPVIITRPLSFGEAVTRLKEARDRDEIVQAALAYAHRDLEFAAMFIVHDHQLDGWTAVGPSSERITGVSLARSADSAFRVVLDTHAHYLGPLPDDALHRDFLERLGRPHPRAALIVPIRIKSRTIALLYGENGPHTIPPRLAADLMLFTTHVQGALEALLLRKKAESSEVPHRASSAPRGRGPSGLFPPPAPAPAPIVAPPVVPPPPVVDDRTADEVIAEAALEAEPEAQISQPPTDYVYIKGRSEEVEVLAPDTLIERKTSVPFARLAKPASQPAAPVELALDAPAGLPEAPAEPVAEKISGTAFVPEELAEIEEDVSLDEDAAPEVGAIDADLADAVGALAAFAQPSNGAPARAEPLPAETVPIEPMPVETVPIEHTPLPLELPVEEAIEPPPEVISAPPDSALPVEVSVDLGSVDVGPDAGAIDLGAPISTDETAAEPLPIEAPADLGEGSPEFVAALDAAFAEAGAAATEPPPSAELGSDNVVPWNTIPDSEYVPPIIRGTLVAKPTSGPFAGDGAPLEAPAAPEPPPEPPPPSVTPQLVSPPDEPNTDALARTYSPQMSWGKSIPASHAGDSDDDDWAPVELNEGPARAEENRRGLASSASLPATPIDDDLERSFASLNGEAPSFRERTSQFDSAMIAETADGSALLDELDDVAIDEGSPQSYEVADSGDLGRAILQPASVAASGIQAEPEPEGWDAVSVDSWDEWSNRGGDAAQEAKQTLSASLTEDSTVPDLSAEAWIRASSDIVRPRPLPPEVVARAAMLPEEPVPLTRPSGAARPAQVIDAEALEAEEADTVDEEPVPLTRPVARSPSLVAPSIPGDAPVKIAERDVITEHVPRKRAPQAVQYTVAGQMFDIAQGTLVDTPIAAGKPEAEAPPPDRSALARTANLEHEINYLIERLGSSEVKARRAARDALTAMGPYVLPKLIEKFPGQVSIDPFSPAATLPPFADCSELLSIIASFALDAHPYVVRRLESADPLQRFFATYFYAVVFVPDAIPRLVQRLHDEEPRICMLTARTLFAYRELPEFQAVLDHLHGRLEATSITARRHAAYLIGLFRDVSAVPLLIDVFERKEKSLYDAVEGALAEITKQRLGPNAKKWRAWWAKNASRSRIGWLVDGLASKEAAMRRSAADELRAVTGVDLGYDEDAPRRHREDARLRWVKWWNEQYNLHHGHPDGDVAGP